MLTGAEKAVLFLLSLDEDIAGPIVAELGEVELRKLREAASAMREVPAAAVDGIYSEFLSRSSTAVAVPRGGVSYLRRLTAGALGEGRAREVFEGGGKASPFARLEAASPDALAGLLANEPPQLVAAVLVRLQPATAAVVLDALPAERQADVLSRVGRLTDVPAGALEDIAAALAEELPSGSDETLVSVDGVSRAAQILNAAGRARSGVILASVEETAPDLASAVRLAMFQFEDLVRLDSRGMAVLLREVPTERLTVALKDAPPAVLNAILSGLSSRTADLVRDDLEVMGKVRKSELEAARTEIIQTALRLEADGTLDLGRGED